jgi:hypothetical protein
MAGEAARQTRQRLDGYKRALKYLDECGDLTLDKMREANRIARVDMPEFQLRALWEQADCVLPTDGHPGGHESMRFHMRNTLIEAIAAFEALADKLGLSEKKWWQFWK